MRAINHYKGFRAYLSHEKGRAERTINAYIGDIERFERWLEPHLGVPLDWHEVATKHVRGYLTDLDVSPNYYHRIHSSLTVWFDYLVNVAEVLEFNPVGRVAKPKKGDRFPEHLNVGQLERLITAAGQYSRPANRVRDWTLCAFLAGTGLRVSEFVGMNMKDIKYKEGYPHSIDVIGKGNKQRKVVLTVPAQTSLYQWLRERKALGREHPLDMDGDAVWINPAGRYRGRRMSTNGVRAIVSKYGKHAGIDKKVKPHLLRHTMGTELARNRARLHAIRDTLGHANLATTSMYLHADTEELEAMAASMPDFVSGGKRVERERLEGEQALFEEADDEA